MAEETNVQPIRTVSSPVSESHNPGVRRRQREAAASASDRTDASDAADREALNGAVQEMEKHFAPFRLTPRLEVDDKTNDVVVKIVNKDSGEVVRQIPPEEVLKLRQHLEESVGWILDTEG